MKGWLPILAVALLGAIVGRLLFPVQVTEVVYRQGPVVTDTQYVDRLEVDTIIRTREVVTSDTVRIPYTILISDPVSYDCPDLPRIRGITRLTAGHSFDDTSQVAVVDITTDGRQIAVQQQIQNLWTPGYITYLEASDPLRIDYEPWPEPDPGCGFGCQVLWLVSGFAGGVLVWELAR